MNPCWAALNAVLGPIRPAGCGSAAPGPRDSRGPRGPAVFQLLRTSPRALGTPRLRIRPAACPDQAVCGSPPSPATWLSATEKASVICLVSGGRGHVWGQVYHLAGGEHIPGKRGDYMLSPRGAPQPGERPSLLPPSPPGSPGPDHQGTLPPPEQSPVRPPPRSAL